MDSFVVVVAAVVAVAVDDESVAVVQPNTGYLLSS